MTNPTKYFINSGLGTFVEWSSSGTPGADIFGKEAIVIGGSGVDWAYVQAGASIDFSDTGGGPDLLYLTGQFADYLQTGPDEFGVYTFSRTVSGHPEVIKFSAATDADVIYFADGHVVLKADDVQPSGSSLQDQDTAQFRQIVVGDLIAGGTPAYPFVSLPIADAVAVKTFINDLGGITVPSLPVAGAASVVFGSSGVDVVYVRAGTSVDFSDAGGNNDLLYLTGAFSDYVQVGPDEFGVYTFTRSVAGKTETVKFSSNPDADVIYFADGHVVMKADEMQASGSSLQDQNTGGFRPIVLADLQTPANPYLSDIASIVIGSTPTQAGNTTYVIGDVIEFDVNFRSAITITGSPVFTFMIGTTAVTAVLDTVNSTLTGGAPVLKFKHTVTALDGVDANGISYPANAITGGTITVTSTNAAAQLSHDALADVATQLVDTTAPTLQISSSVPGLKAGQTATITFTFSEDPGNSFVWNGTTGDVVVTGGTLSAISGSGLTRTAIFTPGSVSGDASITVAAGTYTNALTNPGGAGSTPVLKIDYLAPTLAITSNVAELASGQTATITFTFSEAVSNFTESSIVVTNGTLSGLTSIGGNVYTATFTPNSGLSAAIGRISVDSSSYQDETGNPGVTDVYNSLLINTFITNTATITSVADNSANGTLVSNLVSGASTDDTTLDLSGAITTALGATEQVVVYATINGTLTRLGAATVAPGATTWTFGTSTLAKGDIQFTVRVEDPVAATRGAASSGWVQKIQNIAITGINDNAGSTQGQVASGGKSDDLTPTITGTLSATLGAGEEVAIYASVDGAADTKLGVATVFGNTWSFTPSADQAVGNYALKGVIQAAGNTDIANAAVLSSNYSITLSAPTTVLNATVAALAISDDATATTTYATNAGGAVGVGTAVASGTSTDDTTPVISGSYTGTLGANEAIRVYNNGAYLGDATPNTTNNTWSYVPSTAMRSLGANTFSAKVVNTLTGLNGTAVSDAVVINGFTMNYDTVNKTLFGTLGSAIDTTKERLVLYKGTTLVGPVTVAADQSWSVSLLDYDGTQDTYKVGLADITGTTLMLARSMTVAVGSAAPQILTFNMSDDAFATTTYSTNAGAVGGTTFSTGTSTDDTTPILSGTYSGVLSSTQTIRIYDNGTYLNNATVTAATNSWSFTPTALTTGSHVLTAKVYDSATLTANVGMSSTALIQTMGAFAVVSDNATLAKAGPISQTARYVMIARQGNGSSWFIFSEVQVMSGGVNVALGKTATAYANNANLPGGAIDGSTSSSYSSGSSTPSTVMQWWQVDLGADYAIDSIIFTPYPDGNAAANSTVFLANASIGSLASKTSVTAVGATAGVVNFGTITNSTATSTFSINGWSSADNTPTFTGKLAAALLAGEVLAVYDGDTLLGDATVAVDGSWSYSHSGAPLTVGAHTIHAKLQDAAHAVTKLAQSFQVQVFGTATPSAAVSTLVVTDDSGFASSSGYSSNASGVVATNTSTDDTTLKLSGTFSGTLASGEKIQIFDNSVFLGNATMVDTVNNTWTYNILSASSTGSHVFTAKVVNELTTAAQTAGVPSSVALVQSMGSFGLMSDNATAVQTQPLSRTGRYVMIARQSNGTDSLYFNEVQVFSGGVNVALNKTATAYAANTNTPGKAVDGSNSSMYSSGTAPATTVMQWWQVDLGADFAIDSIVFNGAALPGSINSYILVSPDTLGSQTAKTSVASIANTAGVITFGKTPSTTGPATYAFTGLATADSTPIFTGKLEAGLLSGEVLAIYEGSTLLGDATVSADGNWNFAYSGAPLSSGWHVIQAKIQDTSHTTTYLAQNYDFNIVSNAPPTATVTTLVVTDDSGFVSNNTLSTNLTGVVATGSSTDDTTLKLSGTFAGTLASNEKIRVYDNGKLLGNATIVNQTWSYDIVTNSSVGSHVFTANVVNELSFAAQTVDVPTSTALVQTMSTVSVLPDNGSEVQTQAISRTARYVMIARQGNGSAWFIFKEVQIMSEGVNVALGKTATAYASNANLPSAAIDGSTSTLYSSGSSTASTVMQWWQVDLGADYAIDSIIFTPNSSDAGANANIFLAAASVGSLSGKASVTAAAATTGVVTYGTIPLTGSVSTFTANVLTTADNTPTLTGKLAAALLAGERLAVYDTTDNYLGDATVAADGTWSFLVPNPLPSGINKLRIKLQDSAGTTTRLETTAEISISSSDVPTTAVSSLVVTDDVSTKASNGYSTNAAATVAMGTSTDDTMPTISGTLSKTLSASEIVMVYDGTTALGPAIVTGTSWSFTPSTPLTLGSHTFTAQVTNPSTQLFSPFVGTPVTVTISALGWNSLVANSGDIKGNLLASGNSGTAVATTDSSLELAGILGAEIDPTMERVAIYDGGILLGTATVSGTAWSYSASALAIGMHPLEVRLENLSTGVASLARTQNVQIVYPGAIPSTFVATISVSDDSSTSSTGSLYKAGNATGAVASNTSSDDNTPTISGGLSAALNSGEVVQVFDGSTYLGAATVTGASWTFTATALNALSAGAHAYSARVIDASSGNASASLSANVLLQTMTDFSVTPQGGTAKGAQFVRYIMVHQGAVSSPEVFDVGFIKIMGVYNTVLSDLPGISWSTSNTSKVPVSINGSSNPQFNATYNPRYPETGYTTATETSEAWIQVDLGAGYELSSIGLGNADAGTSVYASTQSMATSAGLASLQSGANGAVFIGQVLPSLSGVTLNLPSFNVPQGLVTTETSAIVSGKLGVALNALGNERVGIYVDDVYQGAATVTGTGWSYSLSGLTPGNHIVKAQVEDKVTGAVKLAQSQTLGIAITTAPSTLAAITSMTDNEGAQTGILANGSSTDDATLSLAGSLSASLNPGEVVQVLDGTTVLGTATVTSSGRDWTFTTPALAYQSHSLTAKVVNTVTGLSGSASAASTALVQNPDITLSVDTGTLAQSPKVVRYVMVARNMPLDQSYILLNEVEVMSGGVNVALGKPTSGKGWSSALHGELPTSAAVDGSTFWGSAYLYNDNVFNGIRYLEIDLGDFYQIDSIKLTTTPERGTLAAAKVYLSGTSMSSYQSELALSAAPGVTLAATLTADLVQTVDTSAITSGASYATDNTPTLSGTLGTQLGVTERLAVYDGSTYLGNATITNASTGAWTYTVPAGMALSAGVHILKAQIESIDGSVVKASATEWLSIPGTPPTGNVISAFDSGAYGVGSLQVNGNLSAALAAGQKLGVYDGSVLLGFASTTGNLWTFNQTGLGLGTHALTAKVTDELGNVGTAGSSQSVTITGTAPSQTVTVSGAVETTGAFAYTGHLLPGQSIPDATKSLVSADTTPGVWGTLSSNLGSGESLVAYDGTTVLAGTMVVNGKSWNFVPTSPLSEGFHKLTFQVENGVNKGAASAIFGIEVDAVVDNFASLLTLNDNQGALTGNLGVGGSSDDIFLVMTCKLDVAQQGTIKVFDGTTQIATQYCTQITGSTFSINIPQLGLGSHSLSVKFYNTAGIEQTLAASSQTVNVVVGDSGQIASMTTSANGIDTLTLSNYGQTMDFTKLGTSTIDKVDLGNFGGNSVKLSTADVLDAGTNLFTTASGWTFSNAADSTRAATYHQMVLDGSGTLTRGNSTVTLTESAAAITTLSPWGLTGTVTHDGSTYNVYTNVVTENAQLLINQNLVVSNVLI